ncbi:MAG: hypothetical protein HFG34_03660 [Eubacterium sp.]|nr:hypothetical protein [Eubacterium sp.]
MDSTEYIVVGSGRLAFQCAEAIRKKGKDVIVLEYKIAEVSVLKKLCHSKGICYNCFNKGDMTDYLSHIDTPKVVFSVMNTYLFPDIVIHNRFLEIINAHNSILPQHPGRNAEAWEIFDEDEKTAVTWHKVCAQVDGGGILLQELFDIPEDITAIKLLALQNQIQLETFNRVFELMETRNFTFQEQQYGTYPIHYARDIPNGGKLELEWPISKIWAFLRAMDYGPLQILGTPFIVFEDKKYVWDTYEKTEQAESGEGIVYEQDSFMITKENSAIKLIGIKEAV